MKLETIARRIYFRESPFAAKDKLKEAGATWDPDQKAWFVGTQKKTVAEALLSELSAQASQPETVAETAPVLLGRASYQGQTYYVLWSGEKEGQSCAKLCFRDGSKIFWARGKELSIDKLYKKPTSIQALREFSARKEREAKTGVCECWCHSAIDCSCKSGFCHRHHDGCDACGCES